MSLRRLLGDDVPFFINEHYQRLPFSRAGAAIDLCPLGSWEMIAKIVSADGADSMVVRRNQRYEGALPASREEAQQLVADGYTLLVKHAERHDERLAELARGFADDLAAPVNIHMYCTPAEQYGFAWHYDAEEVFIVQTAGSKEYSLRKNTVNPWPVEDALPADMRYEREIMPLQRCLLAAGDWLYIPSGYWHMGSTVKTSGGSAGEPALSLAIGVMPRTGLDLLDFARRRLLDSLPWRQRLPVLGAAATLTDEQLEAALRDLAGRLCEDLRRTLTAPSFLKSVMEDLRSRTRERQ